MRWAAGLLLLLLLSAPVSAPVLAQTAPGANRLLVGTLGSALAFLEPRTLEPVGMQQLALWGLRGLTALDPQLTIELKDGSVQLLAVGRVIYIHGSPVPSTASAWAEAIGAIMRQASDWSDAVRRAGPPGMIRSFFDELFNHLDPYSRYIAPAAADTDRAKRDGDTSPGLKLVPRGQDWLIAAVTPDGPAEEAGLRPGDKVETLDGQPVQSLSLAEVNDLLLGAEGSALIVGIQGRDGRLREVELERVAEPPQSVFPRWDASSLVIRITSFNRSTADALRRELVRAFSGRGRKPRTLVLDLRGNRGGLLRQATATADLLIEQGVVTITAGRHPQSSHVFVAESGDLAGGRPLIVMVDGRSASAAEILAAAVADDRRGVVVGSSTLGKGLVQTITQLPDGGELFVTWSRVLAPGGWPLQGLGVLPQVCTSRGGEALRQQLRELAAGRQVMAAALADHRRARAPLPAATIAALRAACPAAVGGDQDLLAVSFLRDNPAAYDTALAAR